MHKTMIAVAAAAIALQGCAPQQTPAQVAAAEESGGRASTCEASPLDVAPGGAATVTIAMTNDGWCGPSTVEKDGQPFQLGLVPAATRPTHGHVFIHSISGRTRIEYTPDDRYVGPDSFAILLRSRMPGAADAKVQLTVAVTAGPGQAAAPAATPTPARQAPAARSGNPARRGTR